eukprot:2478243-Prymnesium_polylepis.1
MKLYAPPLAPCAMIIFAGARPPPLRNLLLGTGGPVAAATLVRALGGSAVSGRSVATGLSLLWFKTSSSFFPPVTPNPNTTLSLRAPHPQQRRTRTPHSPSEHHTRSKDEAVPSA